MAKQRERWGTRLGVIMAVAGSAIGLGNFLRFPVQAAQNGGGAFMIPYFIALVLLGIPLMWVEWAIGRYGGVFGHGTAPGAFHRLWDSRLAKYFGVIGIFGPLVIFIYYTYIESWILGYAFFALTGKLFSATNTNSMLAFLQGYQGLVKNEFFSGPVVPYIFFLITFAINIAIVRRGIKGGIEKLCRIAMPILFVFGAILMVRVLTLGAPDSLRPSWNVLAGLGFLWNPKFEVLKDAKVWLAAAGQIFFTLSVGIGVIITYASYLKKTDDVVLSGLSAASMNELAEVVIGGSIAIPIAFAFYGPVNIVDIARGGAFNLGFVTMPLVFEKIFLGGFFCFIWFALLFLAGITSSVSLAQPAISFLSDEFNIDHKKAVLIFAVISFVLCQPVIFFLGHGVLDELDFWGGTFALVVFATIESILFAWVFGMGAAWQEIHHGAHIAVPRIFKFIIKFITPTYLIAILAFWFYQEWTPVILMKGVSEANRPYIIGTRLMLIGMLLLIALLVKVALKTRGREAK
jgi:SNF family Na+-dependent transporter